MIDHDAVQRCLSQARSRGEILGQLGAAEVEDMDLQRVVELQRANKSIEAAPSCFYGLKTRVVQERPHELAGHAIDGGHQIRLARIGPAHDVGRDRLANHGIDRRGWFHGRRRFRGGRTSEQPLQILAVRRHIAGCGRGRHGRYAAHHRSRDGKSLGILQLPAQLAHGREEFQRREKVVGVEILQLANGNGYRRLIAEPDLNPRGDLGEQRRKAIQVHPLRAKLRARSHLCATAMAAEVAQDQQAHGSVRPLIDIWLGPLAKGEIHFDTSTRSFGHGLLQPAG